MQDKQIEEMANIIRHPVPRSSEEMAYNRGVSELARGIKGINHSSTMHFSTELHLMIDRFRKEYRMDYASVVGCLTMQANALMMETWDQIIPSPGSHLDGIESDTY